MKSEVYSVYDVFYAIQCITLYILCPSTAPTMLDYWPKMRKNHLIDILMRMFYCKNTILRLICDGFM